MYVPETWRGVIDDLKDEFDPDLLEEVVAGMRTYGDPVSGRPITPKRAWNIIQNLGFGHQGLVYGWARPDGKLLAAEYGGHEKLLAWLGIESTDAIQLGWARIGPHGWSSRYILTREQKDRVEAAGHVYEKPDDRLKDPLPVALRKAPEDGVVPREESELSLRP